MDFLNDLTRTIPSSPTLAMSEKALVLQRQGKEVINLSVGEPDLPVPSWVQQAAIQAIQEGQHKYTPIAGMPALRQAVATHLSQALGLKYDPSQVIVGVGAKQVIYHALMATVQSGDEVIIPAPYWVSYPPIVDLAGGTAVIVKCPEEEGFKLTPSALEKAITPRSRWLILNSPSNPTGAVYTASELKALSDVLLQHPHVAVLSDEIYEPLVYSPFVFTSIVQVEPQLAERTLVVNGVSKSFSMTGWRIGYGVGPHPLIAGMTKWQSHSTSGACCIAQSAAVAALTSSHLSSFLQERAELFQQRRDLLVEGLRPLTENLTPPQGAFYVYMNARKLMNAKKAETDLILAQRLLEEALVSSVPGTEFGLAGYLRFSYAAEASLLHKALENITRWAASS